MRCTERKDDAQGLSRCAETAAFSQNFFRRPRGGGVCIYHGPGSEKSNRRGQNVWITSLPPIQQGIYRGEKTADNLRAESDNTRSETVVHAREICFDKY